MPNFKITGLYSAGGKQFKECQCQKCGTIQLIPEEDTVLYCTNKDCELYQSDETEPNE